MTAHIMYPPDDFLPDPDRNPEFYDSVAIKRGLAWLLDTVVIAVITLPIAVLSIVGIFMIPLLFLVIGFVYRWMTISGGSATWGMRMMAIEFRDAFGRRFDSGQAFLHTLGYTVSVSFPLIQLASVVLMFVSPRGQGLTDMAMGTVALNRRAG